LSLIEHLAVKVKSLSLTKITSTPLHDLYISVISCEVACDIFGNISIHVAT